MMSWLQVLTNCSALLHPPIQEQHLSYISGLTPAIADQKIKNIPLIECSEPLVDLMFIQHPRIQMLPTPKTPFERPDCRAGFANASKIRTTVFSKLEQMLQFLDELAPAFGYVPGQIDIKVFEGLRDLKTQSFLFQNKVEEIQIAMSHASMEEIKKEASK